MASGRPHLLESLCSGPHALARHLAKSRLEHLRQLELWSARRAYQVKFVEDRQQRATADLGDWLAQPGEPRLASMGLFGEDGVKALALGGGKARSDLANDVEVGGMHRLGRHTLDHGDARDDDLLGTESRNQPIEQQASVGQADRLRPEPNLDLGPAGLGQILEAVVRLDRGELLVTGRPAPSEAGDHAGIDADLFGDIVQHDGRQQLAAPEVSTRIAEAAELERVAQPGLRRPRRGDCGEVGCIQAMMTDDRVLGVGESQERFALALGHGHARRHRQPRSKTACHTLA